MFGGHIGRGATASQVFGAGGEDGGDAKVREQSFAPGVEEDIVGFEVAMDDVLLVGMVECFTDMSEDGECVMFC